MALYTLEPERATLHGQFSRDLAPVLTVASGDVVRCRTLDVSWGLEARHADGSPRNVGYWQGDRARYWGERKNLLDLRSTAMVHNLHVIARQLAVTAQAA